MGADRTMAWGKLEFCSLGLVLLLHSDDRESRTSKGLRTDSVTGTRIYAAAHSYQLDNLQYNGSFFVGVIFAAYVLYSDRRDSFCWCRYEAASARRQVLVDAVDLHFLLYAISDAFYQTVL